MFKILFILEHEFLKYNKYKNFDRFGIVRLACRLSCPPVLSTLTGNILCLGLTHHIEKTFVLEHSLNYSKINLWFLKKIENYNGVQLAKPQIKSGLLENGDGYLRAVYDNRTFEIYIIKYIYIYIIFRGQLGF